MGGSDHGGEKEGKELHDCKSEAEPKQSPIFLGSTVMEQLEEWTALPKWAKKIISNNLKKQTPLSFRAMPTTEATSKSAG